MGHLNSCPIPCKQARYKLIPDLRNGRYSRKVSRRSNRARLAVGHHLSAQVVILHRALTRPRDLCLLLERQESLEGCSVTQFQPEVAAREEDALRCRDEPRYRRSSVERLHNHSARSVGPAVIPTQCRSSVRSMAIRFHGARSCPVSRHLLPVKDRSYTAAMRLL